MGLDWYDGARMLQGKQGKLYMSSERRLAWGIKFFLYIFVYFFGGCTLSPMSAFFLRVFYTVKSFKEAPGDYGDLTLLLH